MEILAVLTISGFSVLIPEYNLLVITTSDSEAQVNDSEFDCLIFLLRMLGDIPIQQNHLLNLRYLYS